MCASYNHQTVQINDTRWWIGWNPLKILLPLGAVGAGLGYMIDNTVKNAAIFAAIGIIVGVVIHYWGAKEVNENYLSLLEDFLTQTQDRASADTSGISINSIHSFFNPSGTAPFLIDPRSTYHLTHVLIGDDSVVINKEFQYDMEDRTPLRGGEQSELFYDQISTIRSENYSNKATLELVLSGGQVMEIPARDPEGVETVNSEIQQHMRAARRE